MKKRKNYLVERLNKIAIKRKLMVIQLVCVILPLLVTDTVILSMIIKAENQQNQQEMQNISDSVKYTISNFIDPKVSMMQKYYVNRTLNEFMQKEFSSPYDYYGYYSELIRNNLYLTNTDRCSYIFYVDNPHMINGGCFQRIENITGEKWYQTFLESDKELLSFVEYAKNGYEKKRRLFMIRKMDYYAPGKCKNLLRLEIDYSELMRMIINAKYSNIVYVCRGDDILFSNDGKGGLYAPFSQLTYEKKKKIGVHDSLNVYGTVFDIYVLRGNSTSFQTIKRNLSLLLFLVFANIFFPYMVMSLINRSFTERIRMLKHVLETADKEGLYQLSEISGADEISALMVSYNHMAEQMNHLIQKEYKERLRRQENDIARQKAELLALHSQINPHFLFNALESIRMHSVLKKEFETADMVEKLALMQRQNVEWGNDFVTIHDEVRFVEAYLELQKYRFGNKLQYELDIAEACLAYKIPKLTLVTFVENACVHGMEKKTSSSWVFVRAFLQNGNLTIEIEDTGNGMSEAECQEILRDMKDVTIGMLQEGKRVGILNAALRLKMYTNNHVRFELESEKGTGTMVTIEIMSQDKEA